MKHICVITTVHVADDNRIFHREIDSLLKKYRVTYITTRGDLEKKKNLEVYYIGGWQSRSKRLLGNFKALRVALRGKYDAFHFHDPEFVPFGVLLRIIKRKPVVYDIHEDYAKVVLGREWVPAPLRSALSLLIKVGELLTVPFFSRIIVAATGIGRRYVKMNKRMVLINNYPNPDLINYAYKAKKESADFTVIHIGDLSEIRGARVVLPAIKEFLEEKDANFVMAGDIIPKSLKEELLTGMSSKVMSKMSFGRKPYSEALALAASAKVGLLPYLPLPNHLECSPNKLFEYMGVGLPILASDLPGYSKIIEKTQAGVIYKADDSENLLRELRMLYSTSKKLQEMGGNGRKAFVTGYNWAIEEEKLFKMYAEVL